MPEEQRKLGLLKTFFRRNPRGYWEIQAMQGIYLRPRQNSGREDFFEIADELLVIQPNIVGSTTDILGQSIVPIVAHSHGELEMRCLGTGFFPGDFREVPRLPSRPSNYTYAVICGVGKKIIGIESTDVHGRENHRKIRLQCVFGLANWVARFLNHHC